MSKNSFRAAGLNNKFEPNRKVKELRIEINEEVAIVLFEFLARTLESERGNKLLGATQHESELWALNSLQANLEKSLTQPFAADYENELQRCRDALQKQCGEWPE